MKTRLLVGLYSLALLSVSTSGDHATAQDLEVVLASSGIYEKIIRENWLAPFENVTGIKVVVVPSGNTAERRAQVQAMVVSGNVTWDIFVEGEMDAEAQDHAKRAENIDDFCVQLRIAPICRRHLQGVRSNLRSRRDADSLQQRALPPWRTHYLERILGHQGLPRRPRHARTDGRLEAVDRGPSR